MLSIFLKEINAFFSSLIGYVVIGTFLVIMGLMMFVFPDYSILNYKFATLDQLFNVAPMIFIFLIPAVTMRSLAEEQQAGTMELLATRPISNWQIVLGKYFACLVLVAFSLLPTLLYYWTVHELGSPKGNLDSGAIAGSYFGLFLLAAAFVSIGIFSSSLTKNQIVAFILATFLCFIFYWGFLLISNIPSFVGRIDAIIQMIGIDYHYESMSRGIIDTRDLLYFFSFITFFIFLTLISLEWKRI